MNQQWNEDRYLRVQEQRARWIGQLHALYIEIAQIADVYESGGVRTFDMPIWQQTRMEISALDHKIAIAVSQVESHVLKNSEVVHHMKQLSIDPEIEAEARRPMPRQEKLDEITAAALASTKKLYEPTTTCLETAMKEIERLVSDLDAQFQANLRNAPTATDSSIQQTKFRMRKRNA